MILEKASSGELNNNKEIHQSSIDSYSLRPSPHHHKPWPILSIPSEED